jgi:hypothetical protein
MSDLYYFKNKFDQLLKQNQEAYQKQDLTELLELLKKFALVCDEEIEGLKKKASMRD